MIALLIILAILIVGSAIVRWTYKPSKRNPNPLGPGKSIKKPENVFELIFPRLEDDKTENDK